MTSDRIIRLKELKNLTGLSEVTIWRKEKEGLFPQRFSIGHHAIGWSLQEISDWIENQKNHARITVGGESSCALK